MSLTEQWQPLEPIGAYMYVHIHVIHIYTTVRRVDGMAENTEFDSAITSDWSLPAFSVGHFVKDNNKGDS